MVLFNSQVGCCVGASGACGPEYAAALPDWCYSTSTTTFQPADGDDEWDVIIQRHRSIQGRGHLAKPSTWLDPGYLTLDVGANYYNGSGLPMKLDQNRAIMSLWVIVSAPLVASVSFSGRICPGGSLGEQCIPSRPVPRPILDILTNPAAIAINQEFDEDGHWHAGDIVPSASFAVNSQVTLWAKPLPRGGVGFVLFRDHCDGCTDPPTPLAVVFSLSMLPTFGRGANASCPQSEGCRLFEVWSSTNQTVSAVQTNLTYTLRQRQALLVRVEGLQYV